LSGRHLPLKLWFVKLENRPLFKGLVQVLLRQYYLKKKPAKDAKYPWLDTYLRRDSLVHSGRFCDHKIGNLMLFGLHSSIW